MDQDNLQQEPLVIGVLGIQGSVEEHVNVLGQLGVQAVVVKDTEGLAEVDGLIMPGGESTTIGLLLKETSLDRAIKKRIKKGLAVWGTCAGAILLAKNLTREKADSLRVMNIAIDRNAYGRQIDSFETDIEFDGKKIPAIFIRAPKIVDVAEGVEILALNGSDIVAAKEGNLMVTSFHPELSADTKVHEYFVDLCRR